VQEALNDLEAHRELMEGLHQELQEERKVAGDLEARCGELEDRLDLRASYRDSSQVSSAEVISQEERRQEEVLAREEHFVAAAHDRLAASLSERASLRAALERSEAAASPASRRPQDMVPARYQLRAALGELAEEAVRLAE
ncbi:unnamed protein product, partial [Polarella glacialis]